MVTEKINKYIEDINKIEDEKVIISDINFKLKRYYKWHFTGNFKLLDDISTSFVLGCNNLNDSTVLFICGKENLDRKLQCLPLATDVTLIDQFN